MKTILVAVHLPFNLVGDWTRAAERAHWVSIGYGGAPFIVAHSSGTYTPLTNLGRPISNAQYFLVLRPEVDTHNN